MSRGLPIDALLSSRPEPAQNPNAIEKFSENGRIYYTYRQDMYMFPADDTEHERLDILHDLIYGTALGGQLHQTVFRNPPRRILDVGFGSGFWMIEAGKRYPNCQIIGFDMDNALGAGQDMNCQFRSPVDFTAPRWEIEDASVDLVHMSQLCGCVPRWEDLYSKAFRSLRPDSGHIEHIEFDWTPRSNEPQIPQAQDLRNWWNWLVLASEQAGKSLRHREDTEDLLENAGFVDVSHKRVRVPLFNAGTKDKRERKLAHAYQTAMGHQDSQSFTGFSMALFTRYYGWPPQQVADICAQALAVVQGQPLPLYITLHVYTARRPQS
ncbi:putative S-adenosyl-L-methionine-dependent methyltransferase [Septoria linicola]|nr:putative S-adenosyl-L-methionine-dependent methyltransferase [Septoria linicola]